METQNARLLKQIEQHMAATGVSQAELGRRIAPDSKNPRQSAHQYLAGHRALFTGTGAAILDALGVEIVLQHKNGEAQ